MSTDNQDLTPAPSPTDNHDSIDRTIVMPVSDSGQDNADRTIVMDANPDKTIRLSSFTKTGVSGESGTITAKDLLPDDKKKRKAFFRRSAGPKRDVNDTIDSGAKKQPDPVVVDSADVSSTFRDLEDRYSMQQFIAQGHHMRLYKCKDAILQRPVAMYIPDGSKLLDNEARLATIREVEICAQLDHPSILPVYGIYTDYRGAIAVPNKLLDGMILRLHLERISARYRTHGINLFEERGSQRERLQIFLDICNAIEYAHSRNIMHGNLSPRRIFIGEYHEIYVAGWSVARHIVNSPPDPIRLENPEGTAFTAPEYFAPHPTVDVRSDIYSLGMMLYELITLCEPYADLTQEEIRGKLQNGEQPEIEHRFHCPIDSDMRAMILKATAIDPKDRYQAVKALSDDIRRYLELEPISLKRQNFSARYTRFMLKHQYGFFVMLLAILVGIASLVTLTLWLEQKHTEETRVNEQITFKAFASCSALMNSLTEQIEQIETLMYMVAFNVEQILSNQTSIGSQLDYAGPASSADVDFRKFESAPGSNADTVAEMKPMLFILDSCFNSLNHGYAYSHEQSLLFKIEMIFRDGTVLSYPATGKTSESSPAQPGWRKIVPHNSLDILNLSLLKPEIADYRDAVSPAMVIPFSLPLHNQRKEQIGSLVFLISNDAVAGKLSRADNVDGMVAQYFATLPDGKIVYEMKNGNALLGNMTGGTIEPELLKALNSGSGFGKEIRKESVGSFIYCWSRFACADKNFIYLEKIRLDSYRKMMQNEEEISQ